MDSLDVDLLAKPIAKKARKSATKQKLEISPEKPAAKPKLQSTKKPAFEVPNSTFFSNPLLEMH